MTEMKNRAVITGLGMMNAIGNSVNECWENAVRGCSGIAHTQTVDTENCYADYAAEVKDDTLDKLPNADKLDRVSRLALKAVAEALAAALGGLFGAEWHESGTWVRNLLNLLYEPSVTPHAQDNSSWGFCTGSMLVA